MKNTHQDFKNKKNELTNTPIWLYTIYDFDGSGNNLYFAEWDSDINFGGVTYTRFPVKHDFLTTNTAGEIDTVRLTIGNASRVIQAYLEQYDFRGKKVKIQIIFSGAGANAFVSDFFYIDNYTATAESATITLSSKFDILNLEMPKRLFMRDYCAWQFKSPECGYDGATETCNRTAQACKNMAGGSNYKRFGGFPSIPTERIYVA